MSFVDKVTVFVLAGKGGNGKLSFRHEKFIDHGGPDGGDGGHGGDVILVASRNQNTLMAFRYQKELKAEAGQPGDKVRKHGRSAKHLRVMVPVGTVAYTLAGQIIADLIEDGQEQIIAKGGHGGFGNAHFTSSVRQAPKFAEKGEPGEELEVLLEMKMIADVGLVGLPNAGKSTLLASLSNARPEIADYPFTTLTPNLGMVEIDRNTSVLMADIPGLIEGAAAGKGLGHDFLRHVERTALILHLVDAYSDDVAKAYQTIRTELQAYKTDLSDRPEIVALTKIEGLDDEIVADLLQQLKAVAPDRPLFAISAAAKTGIKPLLYEIKQQVTAVQSKASVLPSEDQVPILTLQDTSDEWSVSLDEAQVFHIVGAKIEQFARRTEFGNEEAVQRLRDIMRRMGILHELLRRGLEPGQTIQIHESGEFKY